MSNSFQWVPFYEELANALLSYKDKRSELFSIMERLSSENSKLQYLHFEREDWWAPRNYEIDPFSVMATFNRGLADDNRIEIATALAKEFRLTTSVPTQYDGVPLMNARNSFFVGNNEIWALFELALTSADSGQYTSDFYTAFDNAIQVKGNGLATITMALFWCRPCTYLNLDSQNRLFLSAEDNGLQSVVAIFPSVTKGIAPPANQYLAMCNECTRLINLGQLPFHSIPHLSHCAWTANRNDLKTRICIVCFYYAHLHSNSAEYKENCTKDFRMISDLTGINYNTLRQYKDCFDPLFENGRKGYYQKPLDQKNQALFTIYQQYKDTPLDILKTMTRQILEDIQSEYSSSTTLSNANFLQWFAPLIQALKDLGGSGTPKEAKSKIAENEKLSDAILTETRGKSGTNKFDNEVAWARNYLAYAGIIDRSRRGIWSLTEQGYQVEMTAELASEIFRKKWWAPAEKDEEEALLSTKKRYWIYSPGTQARLWPEFSSEGIMGICWDDLDDLTAYESRDEIKEAMANLYGDGKSYMNKSLAAWQFSNDMKPGDIVYVKRGFSTLIGRGIVDSEYIYDETREEYQHIRAVTWSHNGTWSHPGQAVAKMLTEITQYTEYVEKLELIFSDGEDDIEEDTVPIKYPEYSKTNFLSEVYMDEEQYNTLSALLLRKKNVILQGAPGVGKTYAAKRLAYSIMGEKDTSRVEMIQFHQSYSYEDFIMGYRPDGDGFTLSKGAFYKFCKRAQDDKDRDYFFIIDEINRGNLSKIFGELFMLIEHDKRDEKNSMRLLYADEQFYIPSNIHIIGMMNTADRSLALLDYALRRRFAFFEMPPAFDSLGFRDYQDTIGNAKFDQLIRVIKSLNNDIAKDPSLGAGFRIGHSYLIKDEKEIIDDLWLKSVVSYELIPLLQEYWFDDLDKVQTWAERLQGAI